MALSPREREILALLRAHPLLDASGLAQRLGTTKGAIAVALSSLTQKGEIVGRGYLLRSDAWAVVVGGAAWDIKARSSAPVRVGTSNPGTVSQTPGGVGRNIAEGIARLGGQVHLIAAVGSDGSGRDLLTRTAEAGVHVDRMIDSTHPTASYLAALDADGELVVGLSDFAATDALTVADLARSQDLIANAAVLVVDGNIPAPVVDWLLAVAAGSGVRVVLEPVSVAKAGRIAGLLSPDRPVFAITPNVDELGALVGRPVADTEVAIAEAAADLHSRGVSHVWVTRGASGSLLVSADAPAPQRLDAPASEVVDVTGAGDAMTAGFVHGLLIGESPLSSAQLGQLAAALTVASRFTVRPDLGVALADLHRTLEGVR
ncbi:MAG TPA: PfkB family carbohydrate kinase [Propionicimonas sp.]|nr:PfkB family carbohydrate kinase [Propionicimonas sp.]HQA77087.1 PfkB family carbohydrate kinase [Propionicimonas sp.]HQD97010.1 PfkB family carbohydrate kinase [Propionicimonas sp.]